MDGAERAFAALAGGPLDEAYNDLQYLVQDDTNVHRVVLAWRAWAMLDLTGKEHAHTLLRQSVRFCVDEEGNLSKNHSADPLRALLPKLLDQYRCWAVPPATGSRTTPGSRASARRSTARAGRRPPTRSPRPWPKASPRRPSARRSRWRPTSSSSATPAGRRPTRPRSRRAASTAPRSASTPRTRRTPGGTSPASATGATRSPA